MWGRRAPVRAVLYMGALVAARRHTVIRDFYLRLVATGKPKKAALTACMRKLLTILNAMVRTNTTWHRTDNLRERLTLKTVAIVLQLCVMFAMSEHRKTRGRSGATPCGTGLFRCTFTLCSPTPESPKKHYLNGNSFTTWHVPQAPV